MKGVAVPARAASPSDLSPCGSSQSGIANADLPPELIAELSVLPELVPEDFTCAICQREASNRWNWSPKDYERAPICKSCERGHTSWPYRRGVQPPKSGTFRDRREAVRLHAIAEALADEATRMNWSQTHAA